MTERIKAAQYTPRSPQEHIEGLSVLIPLHTRNGFVFFIAKLRKHQSDAEDLFQLLSEKVHQLAESFDEQDHAQQRFEQFLGDLNETLAHFVREGRWNIPIHQFDTLVGIACDEQMFLSGTGDLCALFLHRKQHRYQIFNLFRSIQTEQSLPTWEKPFAVVLDGDLAEGDVFVISNQELQRAIPTDDLHAVLTTLPPQGATEKIRQYFPEKIELLLIILKVQDHQHVTSQAESRATLKTDVSINQFKEREDSTQHFLADQTPQLQVVIHAIKKGLVRIQEQKLWPFLWKWARRVLWNLFKFATHLRSKEGRTETTNNLLGSARQLQKKIQRLLYVATHVPRTTKFLALGIVVVLFVLISSISFLSSSKAQAEAEKAYQDQITKIEDLMERGAGAIIYKDENQARSLYVTASTLVDQLPSDTPERLQKIQELKETIQKSTDEIRHLISVPNPALLGDLASLTDGVFGQTFVKSGSFLYVFASDGRVYLLDQGQKLFKPASVQIDGSRIATNSSEEDGNMFALMTDQGIVKFVPDDSSQLPISFTKPSDTIVDIVSYANRLYLLTTSSTDGQIYRFGKTGDGYGDGTSWITAKSSSLAQARSFSIDGLVYVLQKNGDITVFESGSEVAFDIGVVDPPITNATDIWTNTGSAYLYVLEPDTKRIIVFEKKTGAFVVQYKSEAFQNLSDILVDEGAYSLYVLSGSKVYSIAPSHISK